MSHHNRHSGPERIDPIPVEMPGNYQRPETLESIVARLLGEKEIHKALEGQETPEEADDFEMNDPDMLMDMSPYELPEVIPEDALNGFEQLDPSPDALSDESRAEPTTEAPADGNAPQGEDA